MKFSVESCWAREIKAQRKSTFRLRIPFINFVVAIIAAFLFIFPNEAAGTDHFNFDGKFESRTIADSTRKDYANVAYSGLSLTPLAAPNAYDKTFFSTINDLTLTLKGDLSSTQILDVKETLHYASYQPEDFKSYSLDSYKFKNVDHLFDLTYGAAMGTDDYIQLDYLNNIYRTPIDNIWDYTSHKGKGKFSHKINDLSGLNMEGSYEERQFENNSLYNFKEAAMTVDFTTFLPEVISYDPISNSLRGERSTFEKTPTGLSTQKAVNYYTSWAKKPWEDEQQAKYIPRISRGDLYLHLSGDFRTRKRTSIGNGYFQPTITFKSGYDTSDQMTVFFENAYSQRKFEAESSTYYLFNHWSNKATLSTRYRFDRRFTYVVSFSDESYNHVSHKEQDCRVDTGSFETYYAYGHSAASLLLKGILTRYGTPRLYFADSNQVQAVFGYDYPVTKTYIFHFKDEWLDTDYKTYEDLLYSSFVGNTWRVALEKVLSKNQGLEIGYQNRREYHRIFAANAVTEKSLFFSWLSHF